MHGWLGEQRGEGQGRSHRAPARMRTPTHARPHALPRPPPCRLNLFGYVFCCTGVFVYNYQKLQLLRKKAMQKAKEGGSSAAAAPGDAEKQPLNGKTEGSKA